jgi:ankyrin repeat protein
VVRRTQARQFLEHGAEVNARTKTAPSRFGFTAFERHYTIGATPFYLAALSADVEVMQFLLGQGADPTLATSDGTTPLMVAAGLADAPFESRLSDSDRQRSR